MDYRTRRDKLEAMANQSASPHEAEIAKAKLAEMPEEPPPVTPIGTIRVDDGGIQFYFDGSNWVRVPVRYPSYPFGRAYATTPFTFSGTVYYGTTPWGFGTSASTASYTKF